MVWLAVLVVALVCAPLLPAQADSGTPPAPNIEIDAAAVRAAAEPAGARRPESGDWAGGAERSGGPRGCHGSGGERDHQQPGGGHEGVGAVPAWGRRPGVFGMVKGYLDILGIPYATLDTSQAAPAGTIEAADLWDGVNRGYYYTVFITTSNLWAALSPAEKTTLTDYERDFAVRRGDLVRLPQPHRLRAELHGGDGGQQRSTCCPGTPQGIPFTASLTAAGQAAFSYLRPDVALSIEGPCMFGYLGQPATGADVTPLLVDAAGNTFLAVFRPGDGREQHGDDGGFLLPGDPAGLSACAGAAVRHDQLGDARRVSGRAACLLRAAAG